MSTDESVNSTFEKKKNLFCPQSLQSAILPEKEISASFFTMARVVYPQKHKSDHISPLCQQTYENPFWIFYGTEDKIKTLHGLEGSLRPS